MSAGRQSQDASKVIAIMLICIALATGNVLAQEVVDGAFVSDMDVHIEDGNSYVIFYDNTGNHCVTSGSVVIYKTIIRFRDQVKMEGRGINQQFVTERVPYEDYGVAAQQSFSGSDFKEIQTARGKKIIVLPIKLPGVRRGDSVKVVFGTIEKTVTAGY